MNHAQQDVADELMFRLSLLRLLTEPHTAPSGERNSSPSQQIEQMVVALPGRAR